MNIVKNSVLLLLLLNCQIAFTQIHYVIEGNVSNTIDPNLGIRIKDGDIIILQNLTLEKADTVYVKNGAFHFEGTLQLPSNATLTYTIDGVPRGGSKIFIDNSKYLYNLTLAEGDENMYYYAQDLQTQSPLHQLKFEIINRFMKLKELNEEILLELRKSNSSAEKATLQQELKMNENEMITILDHAQEQMPVCDVLTDLLVILAPDFYQNRFEVYYSSLSDELKSTPSAKRMQQIILSQHK